jgi:transposase
MRPNGSPQELEHRRKLVVHRIVDDGYSIREVSDIFGIDPSSIRRWLATYAKHGETGLLACHSLGRPRKLTHFQEKIVARWIKEDARSFGYNNELWTAPRICSLIKSEFGIVFNSDYFTEWLRDRHFTPQKPQRIPREQDPRLVRNWLKTDWPRIKQKAAKQRAYLALIDETGLLTTPLLKRTWAPKGSPPNILYKSEPKVERVSVAAAICLTPRRDQLGLFFETLVNEYFDSFFMAGFLEGILKSIDKPLVALWDGGPNHHGGPVSNLLESYPDKLSIERLPPYAPALNPVESVWSWLKYGRLNNFAPKNVWQLAEMAVKELRSIRGNQKVLRNLFMRSELPLPKIVH